MQDTKLTSLWAVPLTDQLAVFVLKIISLVYSCQSRKEKTNQTKAMTKTTTTTKQQDHNQIIQLAVKNVINSLQFLVNVAGVKGFLWDAIQAVIVQ